MKQLLFLLGFVVFLPLYAADEPPAAWTGTMEIVQSLTVERAKDSNPKDIEAMTADLEKRLAESREQLMKATPTVARVIRDDIGHLQAELQRLALENGGTAHLGRSLYYITAARLLVDSDEGRILIDRQQRHAVVTGAGTKEELQITDPPTPKKLSGDEDGESVLGYKTRKVIIKAEDQQYAVHVIAGLPNPYALSHLPSTPVKSLNAALAQLPGLPALVECDTKQGKIRWRLERLEPGDVDPDVFAE